MSKLKIGRPSKEKNNNEIPNVKKSVRINFDLDTKLSEEFKIYLVKNNLSIKEALTEQIKILIGNNARGG